MNDPQEIKQTRRHQRMRRAILMLLDHARAAGGMKGQPLADILEELPDAHDGVPDLLNLGILMSSLLIPSSS